MSKLEATKLPIERSKFDMSNLIAEVQEEYLSTITSHRILFTEIEPALVLAEWDKISQVLVNLIDNAIKYSVSGTTIKISVRKKTDYALISVADEGIGISAENIPKLFERYYRVKEGLQGIPGFGIGLFLCYEIIKRHDGDIWAESIVGNGSTFHFSLPLSTG